MHFIYLIAAYNESEILPDLIIKFDNLLKRGISFRLIIIDNGSTDDSKKTLKDLSVSRTWLQPIFIEEKGLGVAFKAGLSLLSTEEFADNDWIVFNAADLPFNFTDLDSFLLFSKQEPKCQLFLGSKSHSASRINRNASRIVGSFIFYCLRLIILNLKVMDTQGTLFVKAKTIKNLKPIVSNDYFFTTELIYNMRNKTSIIEMPIVYQESCRPSKVNLIKDGYKSLRQLIKIKLG